MKESDFQQLVDDQKTLYDKLFRESAAEDPDFDIGDPVYVGFYDLKGAIEPVLIDMPGGDVMPKNISMLIFKLRLSTPTQVTTVEGGEEVDAGTAVAGMIVMGGYELDAETHQRTGREILGLSIESRDGHSAMVKWDMTKREGQGPLISEPAVMITDTDPRTAGGMQNFFNLPPKEDSDVVN